jgi:hypothetical protein
VVNQLPVLGLLGMVAASRFPTLDGRLEGATQTRICPREFLSSAQLTSQPLQPKFPKSGAHRPS